MVKVVYKSYNQNDNLLFPNCIGDFIPENDPVRVLNAIVDHLDISDKKLRKAVRKVKEESVPKMKEDAMNNGQTKPGYNVQIATENQFITNYDLYWRPTDQGTLIPFLDSFKDRYGRQSSTVCADSGYGIEMKYEYMLANQIDPYVKYNMFHAEDKRKRKNNPFLVENMFYNKEMDFYVCPRGQHLDFVKVIRETSDLGYESVKSVYRAKDCYRCPLRGMGYKGRADRRTIEVNHRNNELRAIAKELLTSEEGLKQSSLL